MRHKSTKADSRSRPAMEVIELGALRDDRDSAPAHSHASPTGKDGSVISSPTATDDATDEAQSNNAHDGETHAA